MQDLLTKDIEAHGNLRSEAAREFKDSLLGRIPKEWEVLRVEEVGSVRLGRQRSPKHQSGRFTTPYLRVANVFDGWIDYSDVLSMDFTPTEKEIYGLLPGDVLLNEGQSVELVGRSAMYEGEPNQYCFQNTLVRFRAFDENDPGYCQMVFKFWLDTGRFRDVASQTTSVAHLGADRFAQMPFPRPKLEEQQAIYSVLKAKDDVIRAQQGYLQILHRAKTGLMQDLLTKGVDAHGNVRSEATHKFKDSPLGRIPKEWEVSGLEKRKGIDRPYLRTGPFGSSLKGKDWVEEGVPVVTIGSLGEGHFIHSELLYISESKAATLQGYVLEVGDVVFSRVADVGRSAVVTEAEQGWIMSSNLMRISLDKQQAIPAYTYLSIAYNHSTRDQIRRLINAGGRDVANSDVMNALEFAWPDLEEQDRIIRVLDRFDSVYRREQSYLQKLRSLKTGLMQDLLTGKVSVGSLLAEREAAEYALP